MPPVRTAWKLQKASFSAQKPKSFLGSPVWNFVVGVVLAPALLRHRPDVPRPEDARVEVDEKILEQQLVDVRLVDVGLVCLLEGSSCGCAP